MHQKRLYQSRRNVMAVVLKRVPHARAESRDERSCKASAEALHSGSLRAEGAQAPTELGVVGAIAAEVGDFRFRYRRWTGATPTVWGRVSIAHAAKRLVVVRYGSDG